MKVKRLVGKSSRIRSANRGGGPRIWPGLNKDHTSGLVCGWNIEREGPLVGLWAGSRRAGLGERAGFLQEQDQVLQAVVGVEERAQRVVVRVKARVLLPEDIAESLASRARTRSWGVIFDPDVWRADRAVGTSCTRICFPVLR